MVAALEAVSKERQDELKEVMIDSSELKIDRLLGKGGKHLPMVELVEGAPLEQVQAWSLVATYLSSRIQSTPEERPGRKPDMTPESADILRAALQEVWWQAYQVLRRRGPA